ncbi:endopeptidase La [bacterium]|nr:endopeptidase La [bacterium]
MPDHQTEATHQGIPLTLEVHLPDGGDEFPLLPLRNEVVFPHTMVPLGAMRRKSVRALEEAHREESVLVLLTQRDPHLEDPEPRDLFTVGSLARVTQLLELPDGTARSMVEGVARVRIREFIPGPQYFTVRIEPFVETVQQGKELQALMRTVVRDLEEAASLGRNIPAEVLVAAVNLEDAGRLADLVATHLRLRFDQRQEILEEGNINDRLRRVGRLLAQELELLRLEQKIQQDVQGRIETSQREFYLREQMRAIQDELGGGPETSPEIDEYRQKIAAAEMTAEATEKALSEVERLTHMSPAAPEYSVIRTWLDWLTDLPWRRDTADVLDLAAAAQILDEDHYGLTKVKERVLEFLAVRKLVDQARGPILCFMGPPGVGKTSIGKSIARAMGREFIRISLGGVRDEAEIRGHRRTYIGALPGRIIQALRRVKSNNPVFMIDEVDKLGMDFRGDPSSALLEVLDPAQNDSFRDHYLEVAFDLSRVMFIATGNDISPIPPALRDRMEVIEFSGYIEEEKLAIAKGFLVPKQRGEHGLAPRHVRFQEAALRRLIRHYTHEAGVRNLDREIASICRKIAKSVASGDEAKVVVGPRQVEEYLGPPRYRFGEKQKADRVGVATGLAYTEQGGDVLSIEVAAVPGSGELQLTGRLGEVMKESAQAALSYVRSLAPRHGIAPEYFAKHDIHIHVPAGAVPKEGPSAGLAIATALASALMQKPCRADTAMTGEVTLHGTVLPIGGVREKVLAAHRAGIQRVILPRDNQKDLQDPKDLPETAWRDLQFIFVKSAEEALREALGA